MTVVHFAVEGRTDVPVAQHLIRLVGLVPQQTLVARGKSGLDARVSSINRSATRLNWLVLRDLDRDAPCASGLLGSLFRRGSPAGRLALRVPVRAIESWLLADRAGFAEAFAVTPHHVPEHPDALDNPKRALVNLCRRSRKADIRDAIVPRAGSGRQVGPEYTDRVSTFVRTVWEPSRAAAHSPSLQRTITALQRLVGDGIWS